MGFAAHEPIGVMLMLFIKRRREFFKKHVRCGVPVNYLVAHFTFVPKITVSGIYLVTSPADRRVVKIDLRIGWFHYVLIITIFVIIISFFPIPTSLK